MLHLEVSGCHAEALLNGVPVARVGPTQSLARLPVHEYTLQGGNELELVVQPAPAAGFGVEPTAEPQLSDGKAWATLRLLLPRVGSVAHPANARTLAQIDWAPPAQQVYEAPVSLPRRVELPISFPRWRWVDAPPIEDTPTLKAEVARYLLDIAIGLAQGNPEPLIQASRLRLEELAQAYQRPLADDVARLRAHVQALHAAEPLTPPLPSPATLLLRPVAEARLVECLAADGLPALRSPRGAGGWAYWPLRLARVEGQFYGLR